MALKVLIVEDEPLIGMELAILVEELGYEVAGPVISFQSAMSAADNWAPDMAIVDVNLTDGPTGPLIASRLAHSMGTEVLMVTANPNLVVEGVGGIAAVLTKPFDPVEIAEVLSTLAARHAARTSPDKQ